MATISIYFALGLMISLYLYHVDFMRISLYLLTSIHSSLRGSLLILFLW